VNARRPLLGLGVAATTMVVFAILDAAGLATWTALLVAAVVSGLAAALAARPIARTKATAGDRAAIPSLSAASSAPTSPSNTPAVAGGLDAVELSRLRHDLRGILSPALLTADRLLASTEDPTARRSAELVIATVERANARLSALPAAALPPDPAM
jgi:ABC-type branched-subunit amino acid transport system permease subunit